MRTLAVFLPNWIGDVVMATPAIAAIRASYPETRILAVGLPYVREVVAGSPRIDRFIVSEKKKPFDVIRELSRERVDSAVLFPNSFRAALLARLAGCRQVVGYGRYGRDLLLTDRLYAKRNRQGGFEPSPVIDDYNRLATKLGVAQVNHRMELFTTASDEAQADVVWSQLGLHRFRMLIGLNPGGAFGAAKHWPTAHFADLGRSLAERHNVGVLVLGGPSERDESKRIAGLANHPNVLSLADCQLSIGLSKAVIKRLHTLITTDSGPRHFATTFGVPAITLFGPTHIGWTETYSPLDRNLQLPLPCGPCQLRSCPLGHHRCMNELTPSRVLAELEPLLTRRLRHAG